MIQYLFNCHLLSDVIITSSAATEGFPESLDYLPGAKFLGIASAVYDLNNAQQTLDLFHNGTVQFGDAHPMVGGVRCLKMPLSWSIDKDKTLEDGEVYQHHLIADPRALAASGVQRKQVRANYFDPATGTYAANVQDFRLKSAYDTTNRRSENSKMFGYHALPAGSMWQFAVRSARKDLLELAAIVLRGKHRIGRSRSAEYGLVEISFTKETEMHAQPLAAGAHYMYAASPICMPADTGSLINLMPQGCTIDYAKSKISTRIYQSWNRHRNTRDADRLVIEKGSVIAFTNEEALAADVFQNSIGECRAEGFGEVLVNPDFLLENKDTHLLKRTLKKAPISVSEKSHYAAGIRQDTALIAMLKKRLKSVKESTAIDAYVNEFVRGNKGSFKKVTSSQWGTVRSLAKMSADKTALEYELFNDRAGERGGYLVKGIAEEKWRTGRDILRTVLSEQHTFQANVLIQKIAAEMAKQKREKEQSA